MTQVRINIGIRLRSEAQVEICGDGFVDQTIWTGWVKLLSCLLWYDIPVSVNLQNSSARHRFQKLDYHQCAHNLHAKRQRHVFVHRKAVATFQAIVAGGSWDLWDQPAMLGSNKSAEDWSKVLTTPHLNFGTFLRSQQDNSLCLVQYAGNMVRILAMTL